MFVVGRNTLKQTAVVSSQTPANFSNNAQSIDVKVLEIRRSRAQVKTLVRLTRVSENIWHIKMSTLLPMVIFSELATSCGIQQNGSAPWLAT